jgi:hypothetical protein
VGTPFFEFDDDDGIRGFLGQGSTSSSSLVASQVNAVIGIVSDYIREYTGRTFDGDTSTVTLQGTPGRRLVVNRQPLVDVAQVILDGTEITDYRWAPTGELWRDCGWGDPSRTVVVTLTSGASVPDSIKSVTATMTARLLASPSGASYFSTDGGYAVRYDTGVLALTPLEQTVLDRYRRRTWP